MTLLGSLVMFFVVRLLWFVDEDGFDGGVEKAGEFEGQRETGVVLAGLDCVDGLAGDLEFLGEVGLGPVAFSAEDAEAIVHLPVPQANEGSGYADASPVDDCGQVGREVGDGEEDFEEAPEGGDG